MPTRRQFLSAASATLAATPLGRHHPLFAQTQTPLLAPYLADVNGDGVIDDRDRAILEQALLTPSAWV